MESLPPIEHSVYINSPVDKVFTTLTTSEGWDGWFTRGALVDLDKSFIRFVWKDWGPDRIDAEDGGEIVSYEPYREFTFRWYVSGHSTTVQFLVDPQGKGTRLTVLEHGYKATEKDALKMIGCATGWGEAVTLLKFYLEHGVVYGEVG
ncbi:MAG TPA: SRPBCC domain-containing protein [Bacteroidia bacterium]|nr:SRPBCC domain-containing protein [Bacteroidia bacterium]